MAFSGRRQGSAQTAGAVPSKSPQAGSSRRSGIKTQQGDLTPELPYNRFKAGEGVLVSHQAAQEVWRFAPAVQMSNTTSPATLEAHQAAILLC